MTSIATGAYRARIIPLLTACALAPLAGGGIAYAQQATPQLSPTAPAGQAADSGIEDIVVTAQRRAERLQDVPAAVTAFDSNLLEQSGIQGSKELSQVTPGLNFTQSVFSPQPTIRGIGSRGVSAGDESLVPLYIDGVYQAFLAGADLQFNNVERIEVLKGPQSILYGRNATGGAINIITRSPDGPAGSASISYGRFDEVIAKGYGAIGNDRIGADIAAVYTRDDGYIRDLGRNDMIGGRKDISLRSKLVYDQGGDVELRVAAGYTNNLESTGEAYRPYRQNTTGRRFPGNPYGIAPFTASLSYEPHNNLRQYSLSGTAIIRLDAATITSVTGYQDNRLEIKADSDATVREIASLEYVQSSKNIYHETYLTTEGDGPFRAIGGLVYYHEKAGYPFYLTSSNGLPASIVDPDLRTNSYAAYAQGTYKFTDQLSLTVGGRYTTEKRSIDTLVGVTTKTRFTNAKTFRKFTPSAILQYQASRDLNIYARYGKAFKSGLFNAGGSTAAALAPVNPETVTQYELGVKADPASWVRVNISGYYTDYNKLQSGARDPVTLQSFLQNAGGARIYGGELELVLKPVDRLNIRLGAAALHGTYRNFPNSQATIPATSADPAVATTCVAGTGTLLGGSRSVICDVSGNNIIRTPFLTLNAGGNYSIPLGTGEVSLSGNIYYAGHSYWDTLNRLREPAKTLVNGEIAWQPGTAKLKFALWGENLLNEKYSLTLVSSATADSQVLAKPRTYGIRASYDF